MRLSLMILGQKSVSSSALYLDAYIAHIIYVTHIRKTCSLFFLWMLGGTIRTLIHHTMTFAKHRPEKMLTWWLRMFLHSFMNYSLYLIMINIWHIQIHTYQHNTYDTPAYTLTYVYTPAHTHRYSKEWKHTHTWNTHINTSTHTHTCTHIHIH